MKSLKLVLQEQFQSMYLIGRLSVYEVKQAHAANMLGMVWAILNPLLQIGVYWLVFGLGIRGGAPVEGVPYFVWMVTGLIPWLYISGSVTKGANSIYSRLNTVTKMNFPLSIIPTYTAISQLYTHGLLLLVLLLLIWISKGLAWVSLLGIVYAAISVTVFLISLSFITSTLCTVVRDIYQLIQSLMRMLFYMTPVLWVPKGNIPEFFLAIIKLNPFYYVVELYRDFLLYQDTSMLFSWHTVYFWGLIVCMLVLGASLHVKFRKQFVDYL